MHKFSTAVKSPRDLLTGRVYRLVGAVLALCCLTQASLAQDPDRKVTALHVESPIVIDGIFDEAAWSLAARGRSTFSELRWYPPMEAAKGSLSWVFRAKQPESVRTGP